MLVVEGGRRSWPRRWLAMDAILLCFLCLLSSLACGMGLVLSPGFTAAQLLRRTPGAAFASYIAPVGQRGPSKAALGRCGALLGARRGRLSAMPALTSLKASAGKVVIGMNKYSHDTGICIARLETGEVEMVWAKERFSRRKHDGGDVAELVQEALTRLNIPLEDVALVVSNNHHFRVLPYEQHPAQLRWSAALGHIDSGAGSEYNLLPQAQHMELSHHLAHVWSAVAQAPFDEGLVVVMDGMGETYGAMVAAAQTGEEAYMHDLKLRGDTHTRTIPADMPAAAARAAHDYREGESAYTFRRDSASNTISVKPVLKRWIEERSPPALYNHGFENMLSAGAVYSRASSNIFGDWNACGKV